MSKLNFFERLVDPYVAYEERDTPPNRLIPFIGTMLKPFKRLLILNGFVSFTSAISEILLIFYLGRLVDLMANASPDQFFSDHGVELGFLLLFVLVLRPGIQTLDTALIKNAIQPNVAALGRWRSFRHVLKQPVGWFESDFAGRIGSRVVQMPAAMGDLCFQVINAVTFSVAYIVGAATLLAGADPMLLVPLIAWFALYVLLLRFVLKRVRPAAQRSSAARSRTLGYVVDSFSNIQSVKLFSHTTRETDQAVDILESHRHTYMAENRIITIMDAGLATLNGVLIASIVGWSLYLWSGGLASVGVVASAGALALRINSMSGWILGALSSLLRSLGIITDGMETVAQPIGLTDADNAPDMKIKKANMEVRHLGHSYGTDKGAITDVSFEIGAGEKVGVVGRSGAGKSTLVKALLRLYDPEKGQVLIDGQDIKGVNQDSLRSHIGMVQQEISLMHRSIRDNILYGRPDASDEELIAAAKQAKAHEFITELQDHLGQRGYDAQVGERGVKLSGGQRQRIALARVILKDAPILILDEATSALDSEIEAQIQQTLYGMMEGKTVIAIAHRLSTIAQMDRIVVLDAGKIVEQGNHEELLAINGLYANLWHRQSGGFIAI